jgi:predicted ester cyclase
MSVTPDFAMRAWFENLWNKGDETTIDRMFHADGVVHGLPTPDGQPIRGREAFKPFYRSMRAALPDISIDIVHELTQGDLTLAHCRVTATHKGDTLGFAATNKPVEFWGFAMGRFADGQLVEGWNCFDFLSMYQQLGVPLKLPTS